MSVIVMQNPAALQSIVLVASFGIDATVVRYVRRTKARSAEEIITSMENAREDSNVLYDTLGDSCLFRRCKYGQRCYIKDGYAHCDCNISCSNMITRPVCGETNLKHYSNECELRKEECRLGKKIGISIMSCSGLNMSKVSCASTKMELTVRRAFLGRRMPRGLALNDPQCKAYVNRTHIVASTFVNECGCKIRYTPHSVIYTNTLRTLPPRNAFIKRGRQVNITFHCEYNFRKRTNGAVRYTLVRSRVQPRGRITRSLKNGMLVEIDTMRNYTVVLRTLRYAGLSIKLIPRYCYVTPVQGSMKEAKCPIIRDGCPVEENVMVKSASDSRIVLQVPRILFKEVRRPGIHVRCKIKLCFPKSSLDIANCNVDCSKRKKRRRRSVNAPAKVVSLFANVFSDDT
eukprot:gene10946-12107_t